MGLRVLQAEGGKPIENFCTLHHVTKGPTNEAEGKGIHAFWKECLMSNSILCFKQSVCSSTSQISEPFFYIYENVNYLNYLLRAPIPTKQAKCDVFVILKTAPFFGARKKDLIMAVSADVIKTTQQNLGKFIKKPPLTEKLLTKPPFRYVLIRFNVI